MCDRCIVEERRAAIRDLVLQRDPQMRRHGLGRGQRAPVIDHRILHPFQVRRVIDMTHEVDVGRINVNGEKMGDGGAHPGGIPRPQQPCHNRCSDLRAPGHKGGAGLRQCRRPLRLFEPHQQAEMLRQQGGFVPGIRPGLPTERYFARMLSRLTVVGAFFLASVAVVPSLLMAVWSINKFPYYGTTLLIATGVSLETMRQIDSQLMMRNYEGFLKK